MLHEVCEAGDLILSQTAKQNKKAFKQQQKADKNIKAFTVKYAQQEIIIKHAGCNTLYLKQFLKYNRKRK